MDKNRIIKNSVENFGEPYDEAMKLISRYAIKTPAADDLYIFNVKLCDNDIDRDHERFSTEALEKLAVLFEGVTGIFDHCMKSENQTARIFKTQVLADESAKTSTGEPYTYLKAGCYMLKNEKNADLIKEIEAGIKKEVSVSCSVSNKICSVCGRNINTSECTHIPGKKYGGEFCHAILTDPTDAYEWSFVAVPAQRNAGVSKSAKKNGKQQKALTNALGTTAENIIKSALSANDEVVLTKEQASTLSKYLSDINEAASIGKSKRIEAEKDILSLAAFTMPSINTEMLSDILKKLDGTEVFMLKDAFMSRGEALKIYEPKLGGADEKKFNSNEQNEQFKI